jgi:hypothetical protein
MSPKCGEGRFSSGVRVLRQIGLTRLAPDGTDVHSKSMCDKKMKQTQSGILRCWNSSRSVFPVGMEGADMPAEPQLRMELMR